VTQKERPLRIYSATAAFSFIPIFCLLAGCSGQNLKEDPRDSKYAALISGNYQTAVRALNDELAKNPDNLQAQYYRATVEVESGNLQDGLNRLTKILEKYPTYSFAYSERSRGNYKGGHLEDAMADADLSIRYRPDIARNYVRRATLYVTMHKPDKARQDLVMATKLAPNEDASYVKMLNGLALMDEHRYKEALAVLSESAAHATKDSRPLVRRATCYARLKEWDKAMADSEQAMKVEPNEVAVRSLHAALLSATGHREEAVKEFQPLMGDKADEKTIAEIADLGADIPSVTDAALAALAANNPKLSKAILTLVEAHRPLDPDEQFALAKVEEAQGDRFRAAKLLNECLATDPMAPEPRVALIKLYVLDNLPQKARDVQKEGLELPLPAAARKMVASAI
jgi:Flp pilus assembly protein TadD